MRPGYQFRKNLVDATKLVRRMYIKSSAPLVAACLRSAFGKHEASVV